MIALGLALALLGAFLFPEWLGPSRKVVALGQDTSARVTQPPRTSYAEAVAYATPAVVNIFTSKRVVTEHHPLAADPLFQSFFNQPTFPPRAETQTSLGSGVIVSPQGYILTNNHVIAGAEQIAVILSNGVQLDARAIGVDIETDIAVLKVQSNTLPALTLGSSEALKVGDVVLAIGNPFGFGQTVTLGIVSATGRSQLGLNTFEDFIQTDAAINPGSSGGALINAAGELVGINTAIFSRTTGSQGIGFAIPLNLALGVMKEIIESGGVARGWLGVEGSNVNAAIASSLGLPPSTGVMVSGVFPNGPAAQAGIQPGDVLLKLDEREIEGARMVLNLIAQSKPGTELSISGLRNGKPFAAKAKVSVRPITPNGQRAQIESR